MNGIIKMCFHWVPEGELNVYNKGLDKYYIPDDEPFEEGFPDKDILKEVIELAAKKVTW